MACPGSVALCAAMPPQVENEYMAKGTLCHNAMDRIFSSGIPPKSVIGMQYAGQVLTEKDKVVHHITEDEIFCHSGLVIGKQPKRELAPVANQTGPPRVERPSALQDGRQPTPGLGKNFASVSQ